MMTQKVKQFQIYLYDFGETTGSVQSGIRPVLITQDNGFNENSPTTIVAPITTAIKKEWLPSHIFLGEEFGLSKPSMVMLEQPRTVNQCELGKYIGLVDDRRILKQLRRGLKQTHGLWDYSPKNGAFVRCLCSRCVDAYRNTGSYMVRRLDPFQKAKDTCDRCNSLGWDYVVIEKNSKR